MFCLHLHIKHQQEGDEAHARKMLTTFLTQKCLPSWVP
jgi:hypothetical protein